MDKVELIGKIRTGVFHLEFLRDGFIVGSGTGFKSGGFLITNNHVYVAGAGGDVRISFQRSKSALDRGLITLSRAVFTNSLKIGSHENDYDFAVLDIPELRDSAENLHDFDLELHDEYEVGEEVVVMGYPLEELNLCCSFGHISSFRSMLKVRAVQIDATVNASNSGGPLVSLRTGNVIGIVTRKSTGLTPTFDKLRQALKQNSERLGRLGGIQLGGVDVIGLMKISQDQLSALCDELHRSSNVGIGYVFGLHELIPCIQQLSE